MTASTALITGASAGIGCELAKLFGRDRYNPVLVARNRDKLEQFATELQTQFGISARAVALDLTAPSAPPLLFDQLQRDGRARRYSRQQSGYGISGEFAAGNPRTDSTEHHHAHASDQIFALRNRGHPQTRRSSAGQDLCGASPNPSRSSRTSCNLFLEVLSLTTRIPA